MKINAEQYATLIANFDAIHAAYKRGHEQGQKDIQEAKNARDKAVAASGEWCQRIEQLLGQFNYRSESTAKTFLERMAALEQGQSVLCERLDGLRDHVIDVAGRQGVEQAEIAALEKQAELTIEVTRSKVEGLQKNLNHRCDDLSGQNANILQQVELVKVWVTPKRPGKPKPRRKVRK